MLGVEDEFCIFIVGIPKRKRRNNTLNRAVAKVEESSAGAAALFCTHI